jgi:hypothetical protein
VIRPSDVRCPADPRSSYSRTVQQARSDKHLHLFQDPQKKQKKGAYAGVDKKKSVSFIYFTPNNEEQVIYG